MESTIYQCWPHRRRRLMYNIKIIFNAENKVVDPEKLTKSIDTKRYTHIFSKRPTNFKQQHQQQQQQPNETDQVAADVHSTLLLSPCSSTLAEHIVDVHADKAHRRACVCACFDSLLFISFLHLKSIDVNNVYFNRIDSNETRI